MDYIEKTLENVHFISKDLQGVSFQGCILKNCVFRECNLRGCNFQSAVFYGCRMQAVHIEGADFLGASLNDIKLEDIYADETTKYYHLACPPEGPFVAYKKCQDDRIVQMLVPKDALRSSATRLTCRCSKAKVLSIKSIDETVKYTEAVATIDDNFVYRVGEWVEVYNFDTNRWHDAAPGIHFWMTREQAIHY